MAVPLYLHIQGQPLLVGFIHVKGPHTVNGDIALPVHPDKVTIDEDHRLLAIEKQ